ncbi:MAG: potassium channel protein [bacterium]
MDRDRDSGWDPASLLRSSHPVRTLLIILVLLLGAGTLGYMLVEGWPFLDSLYMTVITMATVGFGEVHDLTPAGEVFTIFLIFLGVAMVGLAVSSLGQMVVEGEIRRVMGRRHLERQIRRLEDHYVVCGFGRMGRTLARMLEEAGRAVVVIETDEEKLQGAEEEGHLYVRGDATTEESLKAANVGSARGLVTTVASDAENLFITLTAREMNPNLFILARAFDDRSEHKLRRAGADRVVAPTQIGAARMAHAILRPTVLEFMELATHRESLELQMEELTLQGDSPICGMTLKESPIRRRYGLIVIAIKRGDGRMVFNPVSDTELKAGDTLITMGRPENLKELGAVTGTTA